MRAGIEVLLQHAVPLFSLTATFMPDSMGIAHSRQVKTATANALT